MVLRLKDNISPYKYYCKKRVVYFGIFKKSSDDTLQIEYILKKNSIITNYYTNIRLVKSKIESFKDFGITNIYQKFDHKKRYNHTFYYQNRKFIYVF